MSCSWLDQNFVHVRLISRPAIPNENGEALPGFAPSRTPDSPSALTQISDSITWCNVNSSQLGSFFERFRLLLKIGSKPRSRLQQIGIWLDRSSLRLPIPWKVPPLDSSAPPPVVIGATGGSGTRSEEHTSELQSQSNLVCRLLLEKKN